MTTEKPPVESVEVVDANGFQHCSNCRHSIPAAIGARVWCFVTDENKPLADSCCRWQVRS